MIAKSALGQSIEIFCSYDEEDEASFQMLHKHLALQERVGLITVWHSRKVSAGADWRHDLDDHLNSASIILLLISADFIASDYCYGIELNRALQLHDKEVACVIPILLRSVHLDKKAPFSHLQALPRNGVPVAEWSNHDSAWKDIVEDISQIIREQRISGPTKKTKWNRLLPRNELFTGREDVLERMRKALSNGKAAALTQPQAISGLGGIGKTQTALEYSFRHENEYNYIFWIHAETRHQLVSDFVTIANLIELPERKLLDHDQIVEAVKCWLQETPGWLLIMDNADDLDLVRKFLPFRGKGHILLTTRAHALGRLARKVEVERMDPDEGILFLLRRSDIITDDVSIDKIPQTERDLARDIVTALGGLPLALDQAGAYIEETSCGLTDYLSLYQNHRKELLSRRSQFTQNITDHPESVATTWKLSLEKIEKDNPAAVDLLRLCAFLDPDIIPIEIFSKGAAELSPALKLVVADLYKLNEAIEALLRYSLIRRDGINKTLSIHRLVQTVLRDSMDRQTQYIWAERAVRAINKAFPNVEFGTWPQCEQMLLHAQFCHGLINEYKFTFLDAARLLERVGLYLRDQNRYPHAAPFYQNALAIYEICGAEYPDTVTILNRLAQLYIWQGQYGQAEPLYLRALAILEKVLGSNHTDTATALDNLALLYHRQGEYRKAELFYLRALAIEERVLSTNHPMTATTSANLALLYYEQNRDEQAEQLFKRALAIEEYVPDSDYSQNATSLNILVDLYRNHSQFKRLEQYYECIRTIAERVFGPEHPQTATALDNLAHLYREQDQYLQAEQFYSRSLAIKEKVFGSRHPGITTTLDNLAQLCMFQANYERAESFYQRCKSQN